MRRNRGKEIFPDEIFIDSSNLPEFNTHQLEGRIEKPIPKATIIFLASFFMLVGIGFTARAWGLQIEQGDALLARSENNRLRHSTIFSERGVITDREGTLLAWNVPNPNSEDFAERRYVSSPAFSHLLGYVKYPSKDSSGYYYTQEYEGKDGVEKYFSSVLAGKNGLKISETNALGKVQSENVIEPPISGGTLELSIDSDLQQKMYEVIAGVVRSADYHGGAGGLLDIKTGEVLAMASFPGYNPNVLSDGKDAAEIKRLFNDPEYPFLNRFLNGLYAPGSTVKPFLAIAALNEKVIDPKKKIFSSGALTLPNPYDPEKPSVFLDWKAHGWTDMREAIAVSSDVYFYQVGGGFENQPGLGIANIEKYMRMFGFGEPVPAPYLSGSKGVIPSPDWKKINFNGDEWRIGNTYHTSIGQYGTQVTPIQMLVGAATIANNGVIPNLTILKNGNDGNNTFEKVPLPEEYFKIAKEGMRLTVTNGTATSLNSIGLQIAAKTGSAEIGAQKKFVNSWLIGFFPYDNPRYAFSFVMERGPRTNTVGANAAVFNFLKWIAEAHPLTLE